MGKTWASLATVVGLVARVLASEPDKPPPQQQGGLKLIANRPAYFEAAEPDSDGRLTYSRLNPSMMTGWWGVPGDPRMDRHKTWSYRAVADGPDWFHEFTSDPQTANPDKYAGNPSPLNFALTLHWRTGPVVAVVALGMLAAGGLGYAVYRYRRPPDPHLPAVVSDSTDASGSVNWPVGQLLHTDTQVEYQIAGGLGKGGMGAVYEAVSTTQSADTKFAIKLLFEPISNEPAFRRFQREAQICSTLTHPGIVKVVDWGTWQAKADEPTYPFMVMEKVSGSTWAQRIGKATVRQFLEWTEAVLVALRVAHSAGIVHRDLKPDNLMITASGHVKIMDFGVAGRDDRHSQTATGMAMGTLCYMSPEHLDSKGTTPASDIYSMGVILYESLSGQRPFDKPDMAGLLAALLYETPPSVGSLVPDLPPEVDTLVMTMMAREVRERFPNANSVLEALQPILAKLSP